MTLIVLSTSDLTDKGSYSRSTEVLLVACKMLFLPGRHQVCRCGDFCAYLQLTSGFPILLNPPYLFLEASHTYSCSAHQRVKLKHELISM